MSQKRQPEEDEGDTSDEKRQKVPALRGVIVKAMRMNQLQKLIEPILRKVVKEEVESALTKHLGGSTRQCGKQVYASTARSLQLEFKNKLSLPIFTCSKIEGEDCSAVTLALVDSSTGQVVTSNPECSMKVEIVVLEGDFESREEENWTFQEFRNNIVREREGKRSLLIGDVFIELNKGTGVIGELSFTDNSSWTRSRKFRLGARVANGYFNGVRVREAKTESFMVKDHRGELYKKHHPPSLHDEVWRLEKIGKDGAFHKRLSSENINTVKDFLFLLCTDATRLRNILGSGMSARMWDVTVEHARTCILTDQVHVYYPNNRRQSGVVFSVVGEVMGILSEQQFILFSDLPENEKEEALAAVKFAYENWNDVLTYEKGAVFGNGAEASSNSFPLGAQSLPDTMYSNFPSPLKVNGYGFSHSAIPSPDIYSMGGMQAFDGYTLQTASSMDHRYEQDCQNLATLDKGSRGLGKCSSLVYDDCGSQPFFGDENLHYVDPSIALLSESLCAYSPADLESAVRGYMTVPSEKARRGWRRLYHVIRWAFSIRGVVLRKTKLLEK